jgi:2-(1,2-epoxy-1,2-dihydrophenyl)acetyl-CoA isomerase
MAANDSYTTLRVERRGDCALLTLDRPDRLNALDLVMRGELAGAIEAIRQDVGARALVVTGAGRAFCAGGDVQAMAAEPISAEAGRRRLADNSTWLEALVGLDRPVITAVNGAAFGAGFSLALAGDFVFAAANAKFCASFQRIGLVPDCGLHWLLPRLVGMQQARQILLTTREIGAEEALRLGLATRVCAPERLVDEAVAFAQGFGQASPSAIAMSKELLRNAWTSELRAILAGEAQAQGIAFSSDYHRDAVARFVAKQPRRFPPEGWH